MELYVGGAYQGKLQFVLSEHPELTEENVYDCAGAPEAVPDPSQIIWNHFHLLFRRLTEEELEAFMEGFDGIVICDEVGSGIIPMDKEEEAFRERVGRRLVMLAKRAGRFERVVCGIGMRLK
ncbi:MAG: bifunctional adenosylcobinamide kinase/adenosylcobinamide-phosphate guanylyltransferase [Lachnospiraceae bacterium]|nr:bifunctional adenosylcobinamide kinase/adenosylcobinamide-phosphate guanylyltransferase [Lachnospiraceae bacterium]